MRLPRKFNRALPTEVVRSPTEVAQEALAPYSAISTALAAGSQVVQQQVELNRHFENVEDQNKIQSIATDMKVSDKEWAEDERWQQPVQEDGTPTHIAMAKDRDNRISELMARGANISNKLTREQFEADAVNLLKLTATDANKYINQTRLMHIRNDTDDNIARSIEVSDFASARERVNSTAEVGAFSREQAERRLKAIDSAEDEYKVQDAVAQYFEDGSTPDLGEELNAKTWDKINNIKSDRNRDLKDKAAWRVSQLDLSIDEALTSGDLDQLEQITDEMLAKGDFGIGREATNARTTRQKWINDRRKVVEDAKKDASAAKEGMPLTQKQVDTSFAELLKTNPEWDVMEAEILARSRVILPTQVKQMFSAFVGSENGDQVANLISRIQAQSPMTYSKIDKDVRAVAVNYNNLRRAGHGAERAMEDATKFLTLTPEEQARKSLDLKNLSLNNSRAMDLDYDVEDSTQKNQLESIFDQMVKTYWDKGLSLEEARDQANVDINHMAGPTEINGEKDVTMFPVEQFLSPEMEPFLDDYRGFVRNKVSSEMQGMGIEGDFRIQSDWQTERTGDYLIYQKSTTDGVERWDPVPDGVGGWLAYAPEGDLPEFRSSVDSKRKERIAAKRRYHVEQQEIQDDIERRREMGVIPVNADDY